MIVRKTKERFPFRPAAGKVMAVAAAKSMFVSESETVVGRHGRAWLSRREGHLILHTFGGAYERGLQHGTLLADLIRARWREVYREGFFKASPLLPAPFWYAFARLNGHFLNTEERAELQGVADGSGLGYMDILVMNGMPLSDVAHNLLAGGRVGQTACTQIAVRGASTVDGMAILGRNLDTVGLDRMHRHAVVHVQCPDEGYAFLTPGFAGKVLDAVTGWNEKGLIVSQDVAELPFENCWGLYSGALIRRMVQGCQTVSEAVRMTEDLPRLGGGGKTILVADPNDVCVLEVAQTLMAGLWGHKRVYRRTFGQCGDEPDALTVTNHYRTPQLACSFPSPSQSSVVRLRRARDLVAGLQRRVDAECMRTFMTDKVDASTGRSHGPHAPSDRIINWYGPRVRRFGPFAVPPSMDVHVATLIGTVCDVGAGTMWIADGKPYVDSPADYFPLRVDDELSRGRHECRPRRLT